MGANLTADGEQCGRIITSPDGEYALRCILDKGHDWPVCSGAFVRHPEFPPLARDFVAEAVAAGGERQRPAELAALKFGAEIAAVELDEAALEQQATADNTAAGG